MMDDDGSDGGCIGTGGDVRARDVVIPGGDLSGGRDPSLNTARTPTTQPTPSELDAVDEVLAIRRGALGLTARLAGAGDDEGGDLVQCKMPMEIEHPQDRVLAGDGELGFQETPESQSTGCGDRQEIRTLD